MSAMKHRLSRPPCDPPEKSDRSSVSARSEHASGLSIPVSTVGVSTDRFIDNAARLIGAAKTI